MMEIPIDVPPEIKEQVIEKLKQKKVMQRIERKIQIGLTIAVDELQNPKKKQSKLTKKLVHRADANEREALKRIYQYLEQNEMYYTLACMKEEFGARSNKRTMRK